MEFDDDDDDDDDDNDDDGGGGDDNDDDDGGGGGDDDDDEHVTDNFFTPASTFLLVTVAICVLLVLPYQGEYKRLAAERHAGDGESSESPLVGRLQGRSADFEDSRPDEVSGTNRREGAGATTTDNRHQSLREPLLGGQ